MSICYWCGKEVKKGEGGREHIVPRTLLQDTMADVSDLVIAAENSHESCNNMIANMYEHDFCQIIFNYSIDDPRAKKHVEAKTRNLKRRMAYAINQFKKMRLSGNRTEVSISSSERKAFEECIKKFLKGLYFKETGKYLDLDNEWNARIVWNTINVEYDPGAREQAKHILGMINDVPFRGNDVFKYRSKKVVDGQSSVWEFLFYDRFPVYVFLIHKSEQIGFKQRA